MSILVHVVSASSGGDSEKEVFGRLVEFVLHRLGLRDCFSIQLVVVDKLYHSLRSTISRTGWHRDNPGVASRTVLYLGEYLCEKHFGGFLA